nr:right-handed parallel beta-helix repeat-containing protein [Bacteroidota bacterium]
SGESLTIVNNKIISPWKIGIDIKGNIEDSNPNLAGKSAKIIISNNEITGAGLSAISAYAVDGLGGHDTFPYNYALTISNNIIHGTRPPPGRSNDSGAIWIKSSYKSINIVGNHIFANRNRGIYIIADDADPVDRARVYYVNIANNTLFNNHDYGIHITEVKFLNIVGNMIGNDDDLAQSQTEKQGVGLKILTTGFDSSEISQNYVIADNQFVGNTRAPYQIDNMDVVKVFFNNVCDSTGDIGSDAKSFLNPHGTLLWGNGSRPSSRYGNFQNSVIINASDNLAEGDYLFICRLANGKWGKTGKIEKF